VSGRDRVAAVVFLLLGGYVAMVGWTLGVGTLQKPGPGFQPLVLGVLFLGLAATYLAAACRGPRAAAAPWPLEQWKRPLSASGAILFFWLCLTWLGFPVTTLVFLLFWLWVIEGESWKRIVLVSVSATVCLYLVFTVVLRIRLPLGTLFW
jgi:hypothetical protein